MGWLCGQNVPGPKFSRLSNFNFPKNFLINFSKKTVGNAEPSCINLTYKGKAGREKKLSFFFFYSLFVKKFDKNLSNFPEFRRFSKIFQRAGAKNYEKKRRAFALLSLSAHALT